jgi:hypothetical protein
VLDVDFIAIQPLDTDGKKLTQFFPPSFHQLNANTPGGTMKVFGCIPSMILTRRYTVQTLTDPPDGSIFQCTATDTVTTADIVIPPPIVTATGCTAPPL